ncbi:MAG: hypothetical protein AAFO01_22670 [Pseudomonadota bacterium]
MSLNVVHIARALIGTSIIMLLLPAGSVLAEDRETYNQNEIVDAATGFFGDTSEGLANVLQKVFNDLAGRGKTTLWSL